MNKAGLFEEREYIQIVKNASQFLKKEKKALLLERSHQIEADRKIKNIRNF